MRKKKTDPEVIAPEYIPTKELKPIYTDNTKKPKIVQEEHHGAMVWTNTFTDRIRRDECLCYDCADRSDDKEKNCPIAQKFYEFCVEENIAFMVTRCPKWKAFPF